MSDTVKIPRSKWRIFGEVVAVGAAIATIVGVYFAAWELSAINRNLKIDRAIEGVRPLVESEKINSAMKTIAKSTHQGTDYIGLKDDPNLEYHIINFLNTLDVIAYGVNSGIYDEDYVRFNLSEIIYKQVMVYLLGKPGSISDDEKWEVDEAYFNANDYSQLRRLFSAWFPDGIYRRPHS